MNLISILAPHFKYCTTHLKNLHLDALEYLLFNSEVAEYMAGNSCAMELNALEWWKLNEKSYPFLAQLAMDYLALPASSATVERLFSPAPLDSDDFSPGLGHSNLHPRIVFAVLPFLLRN
jgi:hypothetical protein